MKLLQIEHVAQAQGFHLYRFEQEGGLTRGSARSYWYCTKDGSEQGPPKDSLYLPILAISAATLGVTVHSLFSGAPIEQRTYSGPPTVKLRLREVAEQQGLNLAQLQRKSGVNMPSLRRYWYNTREGVKEGDSLQEVSVPLLQQVAQVLGVSVRELFTDGEEIAD